MSLKTISCSEAWKLIKSRMEGTNIPETFKKGLDQLKEAGSQYNVYLGELDVKDILPDVLKQVIGKNGCYFIKTTQDCDLDFVWHNRNTQKIEFWGPKDNIYRGFDAIQYRIAIKTKTIQINI